ncbi:MAG: hypothetical protein IJS80_00515 [Lachnospiraceae bacterium]|nr:hypothetical protein [Lachnospiraceae bacterium]
MYTCRWCGKILLEARNESEAICGPCRIKEAETLKKLAVAMSKNPGMNAMELAQASGVPLSRVSYFMKNGKIKQR